MSHIHTMKLINGMTHEEAEERFIARRKAEKKLIRRQAVEAYKIGYADGKKSSK